MRVAIVDYGSGNLHSAAKAFERAAREHAPDARILVTSNAEDVRRAARIVLPGVGAFKDCRDGLMATPGMWDTLQDEVKAKGKPFLGICVGMQLMAARGLEHETSRGLGWIDGDVIGIETGNPELKVPHMGWNTLEPARDHPLLDGLPLGAQGLHAYFVHSYHLVPRDPHEVIATSAHGIAITAIAGRDNMAGTQFHPEKSQTLGLRLIANFLQWRP